MKKYVFFGLVIFVVIIAVAFGFFIIHRFYLPSSLYMRSLSLPNLNSKLEDVKSQYSINDNDTIKTVSQYGIPQVVIRLDDRTLTFIPDNVQFVTDIKDYSNNFILNQVQVTGGDYKINNIGIGSSLKEVEEAFRSFHKCTEKPGIGAGYYDEDYVFIRFLYDQNDQVVLITIANEV
ncbi:MAG: hypothetical protein IKF49_08840 [Clostridia bacterium]|nr:hypothetical protein [Clostridia bacterium]